VEQATRLVAGGEAYASTTEAATMRGALLDAIDAAVVATDVAGNVTEWNRAAERIYGIPRADLIGRPFTPVAEGFASPEIVRDLNDSIVRDGQWQGTVDITRPDRTTIPVFTSQTLITDEAGAVIGGVGVSVDVSREVDADRELRETLELVHAITDSMGEGVCAVDPHGTLTYVNPAAAEMLGYSGTELLGQPMHETVHRLRANGTPFLKEDSPITRVRHGGVPVRQLEDVFVRADGFLLDVTYVATGFETRGGVRGTVVVFSDISDRMNREREEIDRMERMAWVGRIRDALDHDRFVLESQPIVDRDGTRVQQELLIRMRATDGTLTAPGRFLPAAEEYGLIGEIDRWVIRQAFELAARGQPVEFNLSARSVGDPDIPDFIEHVLKRSGADPHLLVIEVTETAIITDEVQALNLVRRIKQLGCRFALDDFGTGYGGFSYLKLLDVDFVKIDIDFVLDARDNPASRHVIKAVVDLAAGFGFTTVAEGVEDQKTLDLLRELGVDRAQGFFIGRPGPLATA
jgi:PAS domain S-box-containing protein